MSALIKNPLSRKIICSEKVALYAPDHMLSEVKNHQEEIIAKAEITKDEFLLLCSVLMSCITVCKEREFRSSKENAKSLAEHPEDAPFLTLSLAKNIPLWSNDAGLKRQRAVKVFSTTELFDKLKEEAGITNYLNQPRKELPHDQPAQNSRSP